MFSMLVVDSGCHIIIMLGFPVFYQAGVISFH
jgi:hypothetical protein